VLVLEELRAQGLPGVAEVGNMPAARRRCCSKGITDMVRISDARMSGTAYGTVVLHTTPEAAAGGPLALVRNGDLIALDVSARKLHLHVDDAELEQRRAGWRRPRLRWTAATGSSTSTTCCRPTRARTWTSCAARRGAFVPKDDRLSPGGELSLIRHRVEQRLATRAAMAASNR
jgi:dihydroxy-acid dehydratase